jgi:hypothetical protein
MGTVYRIHCPTIEDSLVYIGSTTQKLNNRYSEHKCHYKAFKNGTRKHCTASYKVFDAYGVENCIIEAIEYVDDVDSLASRERYHFDNTPNKVNQLRMAMTEAEYAEYFKNHYQQNKEEILERHKQYREANKAAISEYMKNHYQQNKETILERQKKRNEENKEAIAERKNLWYQQNKESILERNKKYRAAKKAAIQSIDK